ncbi:DUF1827 family protein [Ligilactobacillus aviarius]|uniref:DUF1827 family protein n=1 Tax=Ligilactobacillus aviarius TaxID=1606 RepID=UPI0024BA45F2|nr:DUF1827 family protein [Ligilactobacillus aviarius]
MQLIDVTNSYAATIRQQLLKTTAHFIKIYTLGNSRVVYRKKRDVAEIVISNKVRPITEQEIEFVKNNLLGDEANQAVTTKQGKLIEISINI